jgi:hypothetical protein
MRFSLADSRGHGRYHRPSALGTIHPNGGVLRRIDLVLEFWVPGYWSVNHGVGRRDLPSR